MQVFLVVPKRRYSEHVEIARLAAESTRRERMRQVESARQLAGETRGELTDLPSPDSNHWALVLFCAAAATVAMLWLTA
jgi:hypothetical protein